MFVIHVILVSCTGVADLPPGDTGGAGVGAATCSGSLLPASL